jgi:hypothetical protein
MMILLFGGAPRSRILGAASELEPGQPARLRLPGLSACRRAGCHEVFGDAQTAVKGKDEHRGAGQTPATPGSDGLSSRALDATNSLSPPEGDCALRWARGPGASKSPRVCKFPSCAD